MSFDLAAVMTAAPHDALISSMSCPNSYYAYPDLLCLEAIPGHLLPTLDYLWRSAVHIGRDVHFFCFKNVFVVKEGLVFDLDCKLIDVTRTYHEPQFIEEAWNAVRSVMQGSPNPSHKRAILGKSRGATNYGHFILEMLPRAWLAKTKLGLNDCPVIIDATFKPVREIAGQALEMAGFNPQDIIDTGHEPVFVEELFFVDGLTTHSRYLSPIVMQCLDTITANVAAGLPAKLYAPRRPAMNRDFEHEADVETMLLSAGYTSTLAANMSFAEQVSVFKGAETVVGVTGAALTNMAFCRPGTKIFNFSPCGAAEVLFWMIAEGRRLRYKEIRCAEVGPQVGGLAWNRAIRISPHDVGRIIGAF